MEGAEPRASQEGLRKEPWRRDSKCKGENCLSLHREIAVTHSECCNNNTYNFLLDRILNLVVDASRGESVTDREEGVHAISGFVDLVFPNESSLTENTSGKHAWSYW